MFRSTLQSVTRRTRIGFGSRLKSSVENPGLIARGRRWRSVSRWILPRNWADTQLPKLLYSVSHRFFDIFFTKWFVFYFGLLLIIIFFFQISETNLWSYYFSRELGILMYILQVHFVENRFCSWRTGLFMSYASRKPVCAWDRVNTWRSTSYSEGGDRNHSHRG